MSEINEKLLAARKQKRWSQERAAAEIQIDRKTYIRWEQGQHTPQPGTLDLVCKAFGMSAEELGFATDLPQDMVLTFPITFEEESKDWGTWLGIKLAQIVTMVGLRRRDAAFCDEIQMLVDQEIKMIDHELQQYHAEEQQAISRRQALTTIAALPTALVWGAGLVTDTAIEEFLPSCAASITSCWHLMKGKGFVAVSGILSTFVPSLAAIALRPSKYQQRAARLSVQASIIQGILAMHQLNFTEREAHCHEAVRYATISQDKVLHAAALMYLGYTYSHCYYPRQPQKAIPVFHKALHALGNETSLLRSDILMGLSEAYAQCKEEQEALRYIGQTQEFFPAHPELDPSFDAARVLGELEIFTDSLRKATQMAVAIGSRRRFNDALLVYQQTPEKWIKERQLQALARDVFKQLPGKKG